MIPVDLTPFPRLTTERLLLRRLTEADAKRIFYLRSNEQINQWLNRPPASKLDEALQFIRKIEAGTANNESLYWVICLKEDNELIGTICLWNIEVFSSRAEIGFELLPFFQGKGIMQEAVSIVIKYGFNDLELEQIVGLPMKGNAASIKLLEKKGFVQDLALQEKMEAEGLEENMLVYSLFRK